MKLRRSHAALGAVLLLAACVTVPEGPSVMVLPGSGKSFDQFQVDDYTCRQYAKQSIGGTNAQQAATESGVKSAAVGAAVGAGFSPRKRSKLLWSLLDIGQNMFLNEYGARTKSSQ